MKYDIIVIGSGPGGYAAAIRAAQLGRQVAVVEKDEPGGVCLNWGCIPTKSLLKSAQVWDHVRSAGAYGVNVEGAVVDMPAIIARSREVARTMSRGVAFLLEKNGVDVIRGFGSLTPDRRVAVTGGAEGEAFYEADDVILATGARQHELPTIPVDGRHVIHARHALLLDRVPESIVVVGSGAIGSEFAWFYAALGSRVTIVEYMPNLMPLEDDDVSKYIERSFRKMRVEVLTGTFVRSVRVDGGRCVTEVEGKKGIATLESELVLSAVGIRANTEGLGLDALGVKTERDRVVVDPWGRTSVGGVWAIGDITPGPALAHVASAEAVRCVEKICGMEPEPIDLRKIPSCIYTVPQVASVGLRERDAAGCGVEVVVGKFPFTASGKAAAAGNRDGFVKLVFDKQTDRLAGAHMVGADVTEMIAGMVVAMETGATAADLARAVHPHPTMSEAVQEAAAAAHESAIHI